MKQIVHWLLVGAVLVLFTACGGGGSGGDDTSNGSNSSDNSNVTNTTLIKAAKLVSISSADAESVYIEWLPSPSSSSAKDIIYEVHLSTDSAFSPSSQTRKLETAETEAQITGLKANTWYYATIVTKSGNNSVSSQKLSVKTASIKSNLSTGINVVSSNSDLNQSSGIIETTQQLKDGDIVINKDSDQPYLRRVVSVATDNGKSVATTEPVAIGEVFENLEFSTSVRVGDIESIPGVNSVSLRSSGKLLKKSSYTWKSGSMLSSTNTISWKRNVVVSSEIKIDNGSFGKIEAPSLITANIGDSVKSKIELELFNKTYSYAPLLGSNKEECEAQGGTYIDETFGYQCKDIPIKICSVDYSVEDNDGNLPKVLKETDGDYYISWNPTESDLEKDGTKAHLMGVEVKIGIGECRDKDIIETLSVDGIKLVVGDELPPTIKFVDSKIGFENENLSVLNTLEAQLTPEIVMSGKYINKDLESARAELKTTFEVSDLIEFYAQYKDSKTFFPKPIYSRKFTKVVMAGAVPIVFVGHIRFMAVAQADSEASIKATLESGMTLKLDFGMEYKDGDWRPISNRSFTYRIKAGGEGNTKTSITVRLIPDLSISIYELAAAHMLAEPYLYGVVGVNGRVTWQNSNIDNSYFDSDASFTDIETGAGIDLKLFAGAAWNTRYKFLKWPNDAQYASITEIDFFNNSVKLLSYYEKTEAYKKIAALPKTAIAKLPDISISADFAALPPSDIDKRAIKLTLSSNNYKNPLPFGADYYIKFADWSDVGVVTENGILRQGSNENTVWIVPKLNDDSSLYNIKIRASGYTNMGVWSKISTDYELPIATESGKVPSYWMERYRISDINIDTDGDGATNYREFIAGTDPTNDKEAPQITDTTPPVITLNGENPTTLNIGDTYNDAGATAVDDVDGSISVTVVSNNVDTSKEGTYQVVYSAKDSAGNEAKATRTVKVVASTPTDTTPPVITILGSNPATVERGSSYTDAGATAVDDIDGNVSVTVVSNNVDTSKAGTYQVVYSAKDSSGNEANATRTVNVVTSPNNPPTAKATATPAVVLEGEPIFFDATDSRDDDGNIVRYEWMEGSTLLSTQASFSISTLSVGTHTVILKVTDDEDAIGEDNVTVTVKAQGVIESPLDDKVVQWEDERNSTYVSGHSYTLRYLLALYADKTCTFVELNKDIEQQNADKQTTYQNTNQIYVPDGALEVLTACTWESNETALLINNELEDKSGVISLNGGDLNIGDTIVNGCNSPNGCEVLDVYPVERLAENNISSHSIELFTENGIQTWYFNDDGSFKVYTEGNTTAQFDGSWRVSDTYITILDNSGNTVLQASNTAYRSGDLMDFLRLEGYISKIREIVPAQTSSKIKKTGQTKSYDQYGNEVTDGSVKDDGYYQTGVAPSYSRDDAKEVVIDHVTGLMWQDNAEVANVTKPWLTQENYDICTGQNGQTQDRSKCYDTSGDTAATYCANLTLGGYSDWRLPTDKELESIVDYVKFDPSINTTYFQNVSSYYYWSSNTAADGEGNARVVGFYYGYVGYNRKDYSGFVWCVRVGQ